MKYTKLTMTFLDKTTDKKIQSIYDDEFKGKGQQLGEMSITSEGKIKTLLIAPKEEPTATAERETLQEERTTELSINDFTTRLVFAYKIESIKAEDYDDEVVAESTTTTDETNSSED